MVFSIIGIILSLTVIWWCTDGIIDLVSKNDKAAIIILSDNIKNNKKLSAIDQDLRRNDLLSYSDFIAKSDYMSTIVNTREFHQLTPEVQRLSAKEQDYIVRLKFLEWKMDTIQEAISDAAVNQPKSLIYDMSLYVYTSFISLIFINDT